ncbi:MAG: hypothetical protein AAF465_03525 [Pseudomonadota bacterium]
MDLISTINAAFTNVQRFESFSLNSNGSQQQVGYQERETMSRSAGQIDAGRLLPAGSGNSSVGVREAVQSAIAYDRSESGTLQLRTQEGDIVRMKFLNSESYNAQNQQFEEGGTVISDFSMLGSNSSQFKVVVEGDLNGEELAAIRDVLIQAREMATNFYDGDVKNAFSMASQLNFDSEQLANVNMQFNLRETVTYADILAQAAPAPTDPATQPVAPEVQVAPVYDPEPSAPTVAASTANPVNVAAAAPSTAAVNEPAVVQESPDAVAPAPAVAPVPSANATPAALSEPLSNALSTINNFLNQVSDSINAFSDRFQTGGVRPNFAFSGSFQLQVFSALVSQLDSAEPEQAQGNGLAADTLSEMAMRMEARFDALI